MVMYLINGSLKFPSCSRCIAKGIKCDPRSTRRTSDTSYRSSVKKSNTLPRKCHHNSNTLSLNRQASARMVAYSDEEAARSDSPFEFHTTTEYDQEILELSGLPALQPLPTYSTPIFEDCELYSNSPEQIPANWPSAVNSQFSLEDSFIPAQTTDHLLFYDSLGCHEKQTLLLQPWPENSCSDYGYQYDPKTNVYTSSDKWQILGSESLNAIQCLDIEDSASECTSEPFVVSHDLRANYGHDTAIDLEQCLLYQPISIGTVEANKITSAPFMYDKEYTKNPNPLPLEDFYLSGPQTYYQ